MINIVGSVSTTFGHADADNQVTLSTGSRSRAASSIEKELNIEFDPASRFTEGSFVKYENLEPGVYTLDIELESLDTINPDGFVIIKSNKIESVMTTVQLDEFFGQNHSVSLVYEVVYGDFAVALLDSVDKANTSTVAITGFYKTGELPFPVPEAINLESADIIGDFTQSAEFLEIRTGTGSRAISSIGRHLDFNLEIEAATEGTVASFDESMGRYRVFWELDTYEPENSASDILYVYNGREFWPIGNSGEATIQVTDARRSTGLKTTEIDVYDSLGVFIVDTEDTTKTSIAKISKIELVHAFAEGEFLAHRSIIRNPMSIASKALIAYKKQENYELAHWQPEWQMGYNWYWMQISPFGEENNHLAEEVHRMDFEMAMWQNKTFRKDFLGTWAIATHTLREIYLQSPTGGMDASQLSSLDMVGAANAAISVVRLHYELASEIGLRNNIENAILDTVVRNSSDVRIADGIIPTYAGYLDNLINNAVRYSVEHNAYIQMPVEWIIAMIHLLATESFKFEANMIFNPYNGFNELYLLWRNSWGLD